jgi:NADH:ubiquinone oxidoreductase subunit E
MSSKLSLHALELKRSGPVLVCRKCMKRMAGGGKLRRRLKASLKHHGACQKKGRARLVLTNCFGICPKDAVVTASAVTLARGELLLIRDCSEETIERATSILC